MSKLFLIVNVFLHNINSGNATMRSFDERNAINAPIQGSAADIIKIAMIDIYQEMTKFKMKSKLVTTST